MERVKKSVFTERTQFDLEQVLEKTCRGLPNGGDHEARRFAAEYLLEAAHAGHHGIEHLHHAVRNALAVLAAKRRLRL